MSARSVIPLDPAACRQLVASKRWRKRLEVQANGCWHLGYTAPCGYPHVRLTGRMTGANRIAWVAANDREVPAGMEIGHTCADRAHDSGECVVIGVDCPHRLCVNPDHLEPQTQRRNTLAGQGLAARNARQEACPTCGGQYEYRADGWRDCLSCQTDTHAARRDAHRALGMTRDAYCAEFGSSKYASRTILAAIAAGVSPAIIMRAPALEPVEIIQRHGQRQHREDAALRAYLAALALPDEMVAELVNDMHGAEWAAVG